VTLNT